MRVTYRAWTVLDEYGEEVGDTVIVEDSLIVRVGWGLRSPGAREERIEGTILPGLVDAHLHLAGIGLSLAGIDLRGARSIGEILDRLRRGASRWSIVYARGWDQEALAEGRPPSRKDLDKTVPDRPVIAVRVCGHAAVANTAALSIARPWEKYPGLVDRESGLLLEDAVYYTLQRLLSEADITGLVEQGARHVASHGVVGVSSMSCTLRELEALLKLEERGVLPLRVACYMDPSEPAPWPRGALATPVGVKLFADGSLGARTAYLSEPYSDDPGNRGKLLLSSREIRAVARRWAAKGYRVAVHAIGDAALDEAIRGLEGLPPGSARVEHASIARDRQIRALASQGIYAVVQPHFRVSDWWIDRRLGARLPLAYRLRSMSRAGVWLALSTDSPVEPVDPVETMRAARGLCREPACREEESLGFRESLYHYTRAAARASGGPVRMLGRLGPGAPAALAWTPGDPRSREWAGPVRRLA